MEQTSPVLISPPVVAAVASHRLPQLPSMGRNMRTAQSKQSARANSEFTSLTEQTIIHVEGTSKVVKISADGEPELSEESLSLPETAADEPKVVVSETARAPAESSIQERKQSVRLKDKAELAVTQSHDSLVNSDGSSDVNKTKVGEDKATVEDLSSKPSLFRASKQAFRKDKQLVSHKRASWAKVKKEKVTVKQSKTIENESQALSTGEQVPDSCKEEKMQKKDLSVVSISNFEKSDVSLGLEVGRENSSNAHIPRKILLFPPDVPSEEHIEKLLAGNTEAGLVQYPTQLVEGDMKWAKVTGHPYWPCMVSKCPFSKIFTRLQGETRVIRLYHVQFFGDECERGWVTEQSLMDFKGLSDFHEKARAAAAVKKTPKRGKSQYNPFVVKESRQVAWDCAVGEAEQAFSLATEDRVLQFAFQYCFMDALQKGRKPKIDKPEVSETSLSPKPGRGQKRKLDVAETSLESSIQHKSKKQKRGPYSPKPPLRKTVPFQVYFDTHQPLASEEHPDWDAETLRIHLRKQWKAERMVEPSSDAAAENSSQLVITDFWKKSHILEPIAKAKESQFPSSPHAVVETPSPTPGKRMYRKKTIISNPSTPNADSMDTNENFLSNSKRTRLPKVAVALNNVQAVPSPSSLASEASVEISGSAISDQDLLSTKAKAKMAMVRKTSQDSDSSSEGKGRRDDEPYELQILKLFSTSKIDKDKLCSVCEKSGEVLECQGTCGQHFHPACVNLGPSLEQAYTCAECTSGVHTCFVCKVADSTTVRCVINTCGKYYHDACIRQHRLTRQEAKGLVCPMHTCATCAVDNVKNPRAMKGRFYRCIRCPASYHVGDHCIPAGSVVLAGSYIICADHFKPNKALSCHARLNITWCFTCSRGGTLLCCEACPAAYHAECVKVEKTPEEAWYCEECDAGRRPLYGTIVWIKIGNYRWWPGEICHPRDVPKNIQEKSHQVGEFPVRFFGSHDYYWIHRGRVFLFQEGDKASKESSAKGLFKSYVKGVEEATEALKIWTAIKDKKDEQEQEKNDKKPAPFKLVKCNVPIGNVQIHKADLSEIPICECKPDQDEPCKSDCLNHMMMYECHPSSCPAGERCHNQRFQKRIYCDVEPVRCEGRGWGLRCKHDIKKGQFVLEYVGDLIDEEECKKRIEQAHADNITNFYMLTLDKNRTIDAGPKGNYSRFMNHSCGPNLVTQKWTVNGDIRVGLFALEDITKGTELTFNYNLECLGNEKKACACGAENCSGFLGVRPKATVASAKEKLAKELKKRGRKKKKMEQRKIYEDDCFRCGEGGELVMCDVGNCPKVYHLQCLKLSKPPTGKWRCPWHHCDVCGKHAVNKCIECPDSFCQNHTEGNIFEKNGIQVCEDHIDLLDTVGLVNKTLTKSPFVTDENQAVLSPVGASELPIKDTALCLSPPVENMTSSATRKPNETIKPQANLQPRVKRKYTKRCKSQLIESGDNKCPILKITVGPNRDSLTITADPLEKLEAPMSKSETVSKTLLPKPMKSKRGRKPKVRTGLPLSSPVNGGILGKLQALPTLVTDSDDADSISGLVIDL